ncbi:MAG TPA: hypothetical protein VF581_05995 [Flavobacterium sp.]|jgi:hypothetical protein
MDTQDKNQHNNQSEEEKNKAAKVDEATDFLGTKHGNAMPKPETGTDKTLNPEENPHLKGQPDRPNLEDETPSIH